jgi:hypothetical protein
MLAAMVEVPPPESRPEMADLPPILGSWRNVYAVTLGTLAVLVGLFWLLTEVYA